MRSHVKAQLMLLLSSPGAGSPMQSGSAVMAAQGALRLASCCSEAALLPSTLLLGGEGCLLLLQCFSPGQHVLMPARATV